jgi:hypothetical protein
MVSIDTVYQRVLTLANKEQRGYITPQEFNLLANQAQMEIFEQYFGDLVVYNKNPGNTQEFSDPLSVLYEKIGEFDVDQDNAWIEAKMPGITTLQQSQFSSMNIPWDLIYKIGTVRVNNNQVELVNGKDFDAARMSPLTVPSITRPIGNINAFGLRVAVGADRFAVTNAAFLAATNAAIAAASLATPVILTVEGFVIADMSISYTMRPPDVQWAYVVVNDKALYNDNISVDFQLHASEETELVYKILKLAGVNLKAQDVTQAGATLEQANKQTTL